MQQRKVPMRMCVGCRAMKPKKELLRVVHTPDGETLFDLTGKKSGRGAYVCRDEACLDKAIKQRQLSRALRCEVGQEAYEHMRTQIRLRQGLDEFN